MNIPKHDLQSVPSLCLSVSPQNPCSPTFEQYLLHTSSPGSVMHVAHLGWQPQRYNKFLGKHIITTFIENLCAVLWII